MVRSSKNSKRGKKGKESKTKNVIIFMLLLLMLAVFGTAAFFYSYIGKFSKNYNVEDSINKNNGESINILLAGMDIGDPNQKDIEEIKRTDTLIVASFSPKIKKLTLVSIPRDLMINIKGKKHKLNEAYSLGGEKFLKNSIEKIVETNIDYIVKIDYEGFRRFIDAIGGIEMYIDRNMYYDDLGQNLHINFKKGETVLLDGKKAEEFFRWRKNNDGTGLEDGDLGRIKNQQLFISKVIEKCTSPKIILNIKDILDVLPEFIQTNMPANKIISYGLSLSKIDKSKISMHTIQGETKYIDNISYLVYDKESNLKVLKALKSTKTNDLLEDKKSTVKVKILNATKINGLAGKCAKVLSEDGYINIEVGNFAEMEDSYIKVEDKELKKMLKDFLGIKKIKSLSETDDNFDAVIVLGKDYVKFGE